MSTSEPAPVVPPKKRWSCCFIMVLCAAVPLFAMFLLLGAVLFVFWMPSPPLVISEETTRITGPLTADGQIDFFKALEQKIYPPELATDDNGFRVFTRLFGDVGTYPNLNDHPTLRAQAREFYRRQKYEKLGLDPNVPPTLTFPRPPYNVDDVIKNIYEAKGEEVPANVEKLWKDPWTLEQLSMLEEWINEIDAPLDAIAEAIQRPVFSVPLVQGRGSVESGRPQSLLAMLLPDIQMTRDIARMFQARARFRVAQGDIEGAIDDKLTLHRFGRLISPNGTMISYLVGVAFESAALAIPIGVNPEHPQTEQQIRRILAGLDALPPRVPITEPIEWDRYSALDAVQLVATHGSIFDALFGHDPDILGEGFGRYWKLWLDGFVKIRPLDWNIVYRRVNEAYDALQEPPPQAKYHSIMEKIDANPILTWKLPFRALMPKGADNVLADGFIALLMPELDVYEGARERAECMENLQRLALAILLYQHEHGKMPDADWANEVPAKYLSCPSNPAPEGMTTYAMVQYDDTSGDTVAGSRDLILLVELSEAVPLDKAVISVDEVLARQRTGSSHTGGMNVALRNGAVRFVSPLYSEEEKAEWQRMLGRESDDAIDAEFEVKK